MKKDLIFITDNYPFGQGETFIENEIEYLAENFKNIYIVSKNQNDIQTREVPKNCKIYRIKKDLKKLINLYLDKIYLVDLFKEFKLRNLKKLVSFQFYGKLIEIKVKEIIKENNLEKNNILFYSYWFYNGAYTGSILKRKNKINKVISRAHGYDLYLERGYQPLKKIIIQNINFLYPCSKLGENYLKKIYLNENIRCSYLGTINEDSFTEKKMEDNFKIISCSNLIKLKRVNLIIDALAILDKKYSNIEWVHFGTGEERIYLEELAKRKLKQIKYKFKGQVSNKQVMEYYRLNNVSLFIHLSSTEGLPVSMMEVQSFGIPIIATNVGGVSEVVNNKTGILLSANPKVEEIVKAIEKILNLNENEYNIYRKNSYLNWKENFNAKKNYLEFMEEIMKI